MNSFQSKTYYYFQKILLVKAAFQSRNNLLNFKFGPKGGGGTTWMTNPLVGDHQVAVVNVDEGVLEGSKMSGTHLNGFLVKN